MNDLSDELPAQSPTNGTQSQMQIEAFTNTNEPEPTQSESKPKRTRRTTLFPAATFEDSLELAISMYQLAAGQPVRRITLFDQMGRSPDSSGSRQLVTNSSKYGLTKGSYQSDTLELTTEGLQAVSEEASLASKTRARYKLAIESIEVFRILHEAYVGNRLPPPAIMADAARNAGIPDEDVGQCVETFTVNTKFVGTLRSISGAERLISIDALIDDYLKSTPTTTESKIAFHSIPIPVALTESTNTQYDNECFYISPIGSEGSEERKHSDLFMGSLVEPVLSEFRLAVVRADKIGEAGMITGQIIDHILLAKLVIVDLSFHNTNVFYELALRHAVRRPIVQLSRAADKLPFDVGQVRTVVVDTTDIYSLVPQLDSLKAQIAAQIRKTLDESSEVENPLSVFAPHFWDHIPRS